MRTMPGDMTDFLWRVSGSAYSWGDFEPSQFMNRDRAKEGRVRVLTDAVPVGGQYTVREYLPLVQFSGLFRTFALDTEPTEKNVWAFATKYGMLGFDTAILLPLSDGRANVGTGETLESWADEIVDMRRAVNLWDAARHGKSAELIRVIHWDENGVFYKDASRFALIAGKNTRPDIFARLPPRDLIAPAYWYLQSVINDKLDHHRVGPRLLWDSSDQTGQQLTVRIRPKNLIGCLWLQFAKALEGKEYRQCENCKLWFEVGGSRAARSDKKFCSPTCKAALHRKERERALALRTAGRTPAQIAKELGKDINIVKGWISQ